MHAFVMTAVYRCVKFYHFSAELLVLIRNAERPFTEEIDCDFSNSGCDCGFIACCLILLLQIVVFSGVSN